MAKSSADDSAPVTIGDLKKLLHETRLSMDEKTEETRRYMDEKTEETRRYMDERIAAEGEKTRRHFDVVAEDLTHDFQGIFKDRTEQHSDAIHAPRRRMDRIEQHLNLVPIS